MGRFNGFVSKIRPWTPFTALHTVCGVVDKKGKTVLDVGCGKGEPMHFINRRKQFYTMALDIWGPCLTECKTQSTHDECLLGSVSVLPFKDKSIDIVICLEVLEHLEKEDSKRLLEELERVARRQVILSTPVGDCEQDEVLLGNGNSYQVHKCGWSPDELRLRGYRVRGSTIRCLAGKAGTINCQPRVLLPLGYLLWIVTSPLVYLLPQLAGDMVCSKHVTVR
jgi:SAM-dependent methyltransferase